MMFWYQITNKNFIRLVNMHYKHKIICVSFHNTTNFEFDLERRENGIYFCQPSSAGPIVVSTFVKLDVINTPFCPQTKLFVLSFMMTFS